MNESFATSMACIASFASVACAQLISVTPISYSAPAGQGIAQGGSYNYPDDTGGQLTDGIVGVNNWEANLGSGIAYEWVGWRTVDPTISFAFASPVTIHTVSIGFSRYETSSIFLPSDVVIGGTTFSLTGSELADHTRGFLSFNGSWTGSTLAVTLNRHASDWVFMDEVTFAAVPEPSTWAVGGIFGLAAIATVALRPRRQAAIGKAVCD